MNDVAYLRDAPHRIEAEQMVLGAILLDPAHVSRTVQAGGADLFYDAVHRDVFEVILDKDRAGMLVSPVTVHEAMRSHEGLAQLGQGYLARLAGAAPGASSVPGYLDMLADLRGKRDLSASLTEAQAAIARGEDTAATIAGRLEASLIAASSASKRGGPIWMTQAVLTAMEQIKAAYEGLDDGSVRSGIHALDRILPGFYPGELILLGGRPSMGKTAVALSIALNTARAGHGVCIASLEMNPEAMALRALSEQTANQRAAVAYSQMRQGEMTDPQLASLQAAAKRVADLPIMFLSREHADIGSLLAGAKQAQRAMQGNMRLLVVDYAQLLRSNAKTRYEQITEISIALKSLAGQLNIPVIALSQLSRALESREDKRPIMSDLRESGQLEQDADAVMFCYRDEYYVERDRPAPDDPVEDHEAWKSAMEAARNRLEIIVAKQRQGEIGTAHVRFNPAINLIWEG